MYKILFKIVCFIFCCCNLSAQATIDSSALFRSTADFNLFDVKQQKNIRLDPNEKALSLFVFLSPECPLCQNYTKTINELQKKFSKSVNVYGIIPGNAYTIKEITAFENEYRTGFKILMDGQQKFTRYLKATVTPEAILLDSKGNLIYSGAIDDWVQALGKKKAQVSRRYVNDAIEQSLKPEEVTIKKAKAVGCRINDY